MENIPGLAEWQATFETTAILKAIKNIELYNVNPNYFAFDEDAVWVLDGGALIEFEDHTKISFCWNKEMELMDMVLGDADLLFQDLDFYVIDDISQKVTAACTGKKVQNIDFEWNWYQKLNEDFELEDELNFAPLGLQFELEDGTTLQLAAIRFGVDAQDKSLKNATYLPEGDLLVALNQVVPIVLPEENA